MAHGLATLPRPVSEFALFVSTSGQLGTATEKSDQRAYWHSCKTGICPLNGPSTACHVPFFSPSLPSFSSNLSSSLFLPLFCNGFSSHIHPPYSPALLAGAFTSLFTEKTRAVIQPPSTSTAHAPGGPRACQLRRDGSQQACPASSLSLPTHCPCSVADHPSLSCVSILFLSPRLSS